MFRTGQQASGTVNSRNLPGLCDPAIPALRLKEDKGMLGSRGEVRSADPGDVNPHFIKENM